MVPNLTKKSPVQQQPPTKKVAMFLFIVFIIDATVSGQNLELPPVRNCYEECQQQWCPQNSCEIPVWCESKMCQTQYITSTTTLIPSTNTVTKTKTKTDHSTHFSTVFVNQSITQYRPTILTQMSYMTKTETTTETATTTHYLNSTLSFPEKVKRNASSPIISTPLYHNYSELDILATGVNLSDDVGDISSGHSASDVDSDMTTNMIRVAQDIDLFLDQASHLIQLYSNTTIENPKQEPTSWLEAPFDIVANHPQMAGNIKKTS